MTVTIQRSDTSEITMQTEYVSFSTNLQTLNFMDSEEKHHEINIEEIISITDN